MMGQMVNLELDAQTYPILAMAQWRLHEKLLAQRSLSNGLEIASSQLPKLETGDIGYTWLEWIIAQTLLREAKELIEPGTTEGLAHDRVTTREGGQARDVKLFSQ